MGLLPLEFTDCLTDSPYFRENLHAHEGELDRTNQMVSDGWWALAVNMFYACFNARFIVRSRTNALQTINNFLSPDSIVDKGR